MIAALFVEEGGAYFGLEDVDPWPESRDARAYPGPHPVVAHPPCTRWCRLAGFVEARWGHQRGDDGGCFAAALESVRRWGGVLEHPAYSKAWAAHNLNRPPTGGGWVNADMIGGWTCYVEQRRYGHPAKKATWLYAHSVELPSLRWGVLQDKQSAAAVSWCGNRIRSEASPAAQIADRRRLTKKESKATPAEFREVLIAMARSAVR